MRYKQFKNAGVSVSILSVGTWAIGGTGYGEVNETDSIAAIRAMLDNGVNLIDTAPGYGAGYAEKICGKAITGCDRSKIFLATKCGIGSTTLEARQHPEVKNGIRDGRYENILYECEQSLRRLGTDYIDFFFVHWPDYDVPFAETMEAMNTLKREGKVRFIGLSNFSQEQIKECMKTCRIDAIQPPYSMVARRDEPLLKWCVEQGIDSLTYSSLGAGILTGKYREPRVFGENDPRNSFYPFFKEPNFSKIMKVLAVMDRISEETGKPLSQIAINWTTQKDYVSTALCGARNAQQGIENCLAADWMLTEQQLLDLDSAIAEYLDFDGTAPIQ